MAIEDKDNNNIIRTETISLREDRNNNNNTNSFSDENNISSNDRENAINKHNSSELKWLYLKSGIYLNQGKYEIKVHSTSNSKIDLDSVIVYSNNTTTKTMLLRL